MMSYKKAVSPTDVALKGHKSSSLLMPMISFFIVILAICLFVVFSGKKTSEPYLLGLIALLALVGLWSIFLYVGGWIGFLKSNNDKKISQGLVLPDDFAIPLVYTDLNLTIKSFNNAFKEIFPEVAINIPLNNNFIHLNDSSDKIYRLSQAGKNKTSLKEIITVGDKHFLVSAQLEKDDLIWLFENRSEEVAAQNAIYQNANQTFQLLDEAPAGFFAADANGKVTFINNTLAKSFGIDLAQFNAGTLELKDLMPESFVPIFTSVIKRDQGVALLDGILKTPNQGEKPVQFHTKVITNQGKSILFTLVTDKKNGINPKTPADKIQALFQTFFDHSPLGLVIVTLKGEIKRTNTAFLQLNHSISDGHLNWKNLIELVEDANKIEMSHSIRLSIQNRKSIVIDAPLKGEGKRWGKFYISPLDMPDEEGESAFVYVIETTEQKSLQEQFAQSQKMQAIGQLAGGIAHDFNNVLQAIIGNADLMLMNMRTTDIGFTEIREIKSNSNRAASLVRQLLAFSRQQTFKVQTLQLNDVIHEMNALIKRSIAEKMKLITEYGRDIWQVKADVTQLEQVLLNLAVNARDAMPNGGNLTLKTQNIPTETVPSLKRPEMPISDYVLLQVTDTGTGMPQSVIDKIFDPFFTTKELGKGTGLGLSTVYGIIKQSGGFVYVDSTPDVGTTFRIYLPRFIDTAPAKAVVDKIELVKEPPAPDMTGNGTILYVEDEMAVRAFGVRALTSRGYTVLQAESGVEALELYEEHEGKVDLVISDVVMPEMDGPTLLGELRKHNPKLKFIFASGYAEEAFAKNLPEGQEFHFMAKPFQMATLIKTVKDVMAS
jgi:two-component system, cell cycle sensor histidine kinase and response regulator CckA